MAIVKTPFRIQPAFNTVMVTDDENTSLLVSGVSPTPEETITLNRVIMNGSADFNLKGFLSRMFRDTREPIETPNLAPWVYRDNRLAVNYRIGADDTEYLALNAVKQVGESLDIAAEDASPILTERAPSGDGSITIPCYDGYPVGFSAAWRDKYELDTSNAFIVTLDAVAGVAYTFPVSGQGLILWGDDEVEDVPIGTSYKSHTYTESGIKILMCVPTTGDILHDHLLQGTSSAPLQAYRARIRTVEQFSTKLTNAKFIRCIGLQRVNAPWRATTCAPNSMFEGCTNLESNINAAGDGADGIAPNFFASVTSTAVVSFSRTFYGCTKIVVPPDGFFGGVGAYSSSFDSCFFLCTSLVGVTDNMLPTTTRTSVGVNYMFEGCSSLQIIPNELFKPLGTSITTFINTFKDCTSLSVPPADIFRYNTAATNFHRVFMGCTNLGYPHKDIFRYNTAVNNFQESFYSCTSLVAIPIGLFQYNTLANSFYLTFRGCSGLTSIPQDIFRYNTLVITFRSTFSGCSGLTSIPQDVFKYNTAVTEFGNVFYNCNALTTIPQDIFKHNTDATVFNGAFSLCSGLTSIPDELFKHNHLATSFDDVFTSCRALTGIPYDIFKYNTRITTIARAFKSCSSLKTVTGDLAENCSDLVIVTSCFDDDTVIIIPTSLFSRNKKITNFNSCFSAEVQIAATGLTPITHEGYRLWERAGKAGYPTTITGTRCFYRRTGLTEYGGIPSNWK